MATVKDVPQRQEGGLRTKPGYVAPQLGDKHPKITVITVVFNAVEVV